MGVAVCSRRSAQNIPPPIPSHPPHHPGGERLGVGDLGDGLDECFAADLGVFAVEAAVEVGGQVGHALHGGGGGLQQARLQQGGGEFVGRHARANHHAGRCELGQATAHAVEQQGPVFAGFGVADDLVEAAPDDGLGVGLEVEEACKLFWRAAAVQEASDGGAAAPTLDLEIKIKSTLKLSVILRLVTDPSAKSQSHRVCRRSRPKPEAPTPHHPYPLHANL